MANFKGYLLKCGDKLFPEKYMALDTYKSTDNQRTELRAKRNANNLLTRQTSPNFKTKIEFELVKNLHLEQWEEVKAVLDAATVSKIERKVAAEYWCSEELRYKPMSSYVPDITFQIKSHTTDDIIYSNIRIALIEY